MAAVDTKPPYRANGPPRADFRTRAFQCLLEAHSHSHAAGCFLPLGGSRMNCSLAPLKVDRDRSIRRRSSSSSSNDDESTIVHLATLTWATLVQLKDAHAESACSLLGLVRHVFLRRSPFTRNSRQPKPRFSQNKSSSKQ